MREWEQAGNGVVAPAQAIEAKCELLEQVGGWTTKGRWLRAAGYRAGKGRDIGRGAILITLNIV